MDAKTNDRHNQGLQISRKENHMTWLIKDNMIVQDDDRETIICQLGGHISNPEVAKDAALLLAAPELLAALKECADLMLSNGLDECDAHIAACSAIAKATGETNA
jgi:hypothetical protein